jgi:hypothetical protein
VLADELGRSAHALVEECPDLPEDAEMRHLAFTRATEAQQHATHVLGLIANRKFCRAIVVDAPTTAIFLFDSASRQRKYRVPMATFAKNVSSEAIANTDSNLYHETEPFDAGLLGQMKPFSEAIYGDFWLVEGLGRSFGSPLDIDYQIQRAWTAVHWAAYARVTLIVLRSYIRTTGGHQHSFALSRALHDLRFAYSDFYKLGEGEQAKLFETDQFKRFEVAVDWVSEAMRVLSEEASTPAQKMRRRHHAHIDIYDQLVDLMFDIVCAAATIKQKSFSTWHIQYSSTWTHLFGDVESTDRVHKVIQFKLRRKIYDSVSELSSHTNFQSASVLGLCLCVCGLYDGPQTPRSYRPLARALKRWTQREYPKLRQRDLGLANAVLFGSISFDERRHALVKTYEAIGSKEPAQTLLPLDGQRLPLAPGSFRRVKVAARKGAA